MNNPNEILFQFDENEFSEIMAASEPSTFPDNTEVNFRFVGLRADKEGKKVRTYKKFEKELPYVMLILEPFGNPQGENFKEVDMFMPMPFAPAKGNVEQEKAANQARTRYKKLFTAFGLTPTNAFSEALFLGKQVRAIVGVETSEQYGDKNVIKKFVMPGSTGLGMFDNSALNTETGEAGEARTLFS